MLLPALSLLMLGSAPAADLEIEWRGAPGCVATEHLGPRVAELMKQPAAPPATLGLSAMREGERWRVSLGVRDSTRSIDRTLRGRDCRTLTEAVALIVAVQFDPIAAAGSTGPQAGTGDEPGLAPASPTMVPAAPPTEPTPRPAPLDSDGPPTTPPSSPPPGPAERPTPRPRPRAILASSATAELGVLPRGAASLELATGLAWTHARLELGGLVSRGPPATPSGSSAVGGRFALYTGLVRGCGVARRGRFELPLCGGLELGDLRASGTGLTRPTTVDALWVAVTGGARPQWIPRPRLAVGGLLDLVAPLRRHRFGTAETGLVHAVDPIAARLGLRVELRLP